MEKLDVKKILSGEFTWRSLPFAAATPTPTSLEYKTGKWRIERPVINQLKCTKCLLCWIYCPDLAIKRKEDNSVEVDYEFCKGCGICADICPPEAIEMVEER